MKMKRLLMIGFSACLFTAQAQVELKMKKNVPETKVDRGRPRSIDERIKDTKDDNKTQGGTSTGSSTGTIKRSYRNVVRKWGQYVGVGKQLTAEQARHLSCSYTLSFNSLGLCVQMEAYDGYGRLTTNHDISTYLTENSRGDYRVNSNVAELLDDVCSWRFSYNNDKRLEREEGYNSNGSLVYVMHMNHSEGKASGSYDNQYGEPLFLRADTLQTPPTIFCVTYDNDGYDARLETFDNNGFPCRNLDGVYSWRRTYDGQGRKISEASCDLRGERTLDDWGNCGFDISYPDSQHETLTYRDAEWKVIPMPGNLSYEHEGVAIIKEIFDTYGRLEQVSFYDSEERKINNKPGFHRKEYKYNDHGETTWITYYDVHGNLFCKDSSVVARIHYEYDTQGRTILYEKYNAYNELVNGSDNFAKKTFSYQGDIQTCERRWRQWHGKIVQSYDDTLRIIPRTGHRIGVRSFPYDPDVVIHYEKDKSGRYLLWQYCDTLDTPIIYGDYKYSTNITTYEDLPGHKLLITDAYRTPDGKLVMNPELNSPYAYNIILRDSVAQTVHIKDFDADSVIIRNVIKHYSRPDLAEMDYFISLNPYDEPSRWGNESENYIKQKVLRNYKGDVVAWFAYNEFDEPSYMESYDGASHIELKQSGSTQLLDIDGNTTPDNFVWVNSYAMSIICLDQRGRQWGLRDGDFILSMGEWDWRKEKPNDALDELWRESMRNVHQQKSIKVIRFHTEAGHVESQLVSIQLPEGTMADLGLFFQRIMLTPTEKERFLAAADHFLPMAKEVENEGSNNSVSLRMRVPRGYGKYSPMYAHNIPQTLRSSHIPLLLYDISQDANGHNVAKKRWAYGDDFDVFIDIANNSTNCWLFASTDFQTCNKEPINEDLSGMSLYSQVTVTENARLQEMTDSLQSIYDIALRLEEQARLVNIEYAIAAWLEPDWQHGDLTPEQLVSEFFKVDGTFIVKDSSIVRHIGVLPAAYKVSKYYSYNDDDNGPSDALKELMLRADLSQFQLLGQRHPSENIYEQVWVRKKKKQVIELFYVRQIDQSYDLYYLPSIIPENEVDEIERKLSRP